MASLTSFIRRKREHSLRVFGPVQGTAGVLAHLRKELLEIEQDPSDLTEWVDAILLGIEGAWRSGHSPEEVALAIVAKQTRNEERKWPDWRGMTPDQPIEHVREPK